jgi:hypothetical protein
MHERTFGWNHLVLYAAVALLLTPAVARGNTCSATARLLASACRLETREDAQVERAICLNLSDPVEQEECEAERIAALEEAREECREQHEARLAVCESLGEAPYDPVIDPVNFVVGIDNPFAPFAPNSRWVYEGETDEGFEQVVVEVLEETREILGVACTVVRDRVFLDDELVEDTLDWVAQDVDGNVWYFGEIAQNFEDGRLANLDGSWEAGVEGAKPGYWVKATPTEGEVYRQEWAPDEAEDVVAVLNLDAPVEVPFANGVPVLQTRDQTPLEPDTFELKFYVPGVGLVLEVNPESGEQLELVEFSLQ